VHVQDWGYTVYSTLGAFYIPLGFMTVIYLNIYRAARSRIRKKQFRRQINSSVVSDDATVTAATETAASSSLNGRRAASGRGQAPWSRPRPPPPVQLSLDTPTTPSLLLPPDTLETVISGAAAEDQQMDGTSPTSLEFPAEPGEPRRAGGGEVAATASQRLATERRAAKKREQTRERKAARTLGIITGTFVVCWLPFFILALVRPFCADRCHYPDLLVSVIGWLGYVNSLLNPVIYTVFNPDFRLAFRKILFGRYGAAGDAGRWRASTHNGRTRSSRSR